MTTLHIITNSVKFGPQFRRFSEKINQLNGLRVVGKAVKINSLKLSHSTINEYKNWETIFKPKTFQLDPSRTFQLLYLTSCIQFFFMEQTIQLTFGELNFEGLSLMRYCLKKWNYFEQSIRNFLIKSGQL